MMDANHALHHAVQQLENLIPASLPSIAEYNDAWSLMPRYLEIAEISLDDLVSLPVIHVAGTKGKGSTCAMIEAILRATGYHTGLFTSPHLCDIRERIRLNGSKIKSDIFIQEVEWLLQRFHQHASDGLPLPGYFQFLTVMALRVFVANRVDVAILEVGLGGRLDPTNVIPSPVICGITSLGFDHMDILGRSLKQIAREKAGIFKRGAIAFTMMQFQEAKEVLEQRAEDIGIPLINVGYFAKFENLNEIKSDQFKRGYQTTNATLAVHMAMAFEEAAWKLPKRPALRRDHASYAERMECLRKHHRIPDLYLQALSSLEWPGRSQIIRDEDLKNKGKNHRRLPEWTLDARLINEAHGRENLSFYLDGAHTVESLSACVNWYASETSLLVDPIRLLMFHCQPSKDIQKLLQSIHMGMKNNQMDFQHVFFVPPVSRRFQMDDEFRHERLQLQMWKTVLQETGSIERQPMTQIARSEGFVKMDVEGVRGSVFPSVLSSLGWFRNFASDHRTLNMHVLVTGSLYLVGDVLKLLGRSPK